MTELATQRADQDGRDVQSELEQLTDELTREQQELKRIKTVRQAPSLPSQKTNHCLLPYSRKYWEELNLAIEPKIDITRILADLNLAVWYEIAIRIYVSRKFGGF